MNKFRPASSLLKRNLNLFQLSSTRYFSDSVESKGDNTHQSATPSPSEELATQQNSNSKEQPADEQQPQKPTAMYTATELSRLEELRRNPYPRNPFFRPIAPISNFSREMVYKMWSEEKLKPLQIAKKLGISKVRVDAIIRMKWLEKEIFSDPNKAPFPVQENLASGMDKLTRSVNLSSAFVREPVRFITEERLKPFFQLIDDNDPLAPPKLDVQFQGDPVQQKRNEIIVPELKVGEKFKMVVVDTAPRRRRAELPDDV
ncbi:hypothetical protein HK098_006698 [Nowakowskiella sp. JEL0407]|nr:hypothetical protein HK098_006698 [Nowakowskiella sp. JEL0407]